MKASRHALLAVTLLASHAFAIDIEDVRAAWETRERNAESYFYSLHTVDSPTKEMRDKPQAERKPINDLFGEDTVETLSRSCQFSKTPLFYSYLSYGDVVDNFSGEIVKSKGVQTYDRKKKIERRSLHTWFSQKTLDQFDKPYLPSYQEKHSDDVPRHFIVGSNLLPIHFFHVPKQVLSALGWKLGEIVPSDHVHLPDDESNLLKLKLTRGNDRWSSTVEVNPKLNYAPVKWTWLLDGKQVCEHVIEYRQHIRSDSERTAVQSFRITRPEKVLEAIVSEVRFDDEVLDSETSANIEN